MPKSNEDKELQALTEEELQFCDLYVSGGLEYAGRPSKCYKAGMGRKRRRIRLHPPIIC